ncbi:hypothetical protein BLA24064_01001 [Burkholderia latens]|uniref:Uncharacterized protein n=1 Tax=Burkholderia latens TaxID=488446 RepID=A0A6P2I232_9BURK|nr:hypothetical protein BLA24064_01001 [Burkholderia latens]
MRLQALLLQSVSTIVQKTGTHRLLAHTTLPQRVNPLPLGMQTM